METHEDDFVEHLVSTSTHDTILFFTNKGKVYRLKGYEIPEFGRTAKGLPIINLLQIEKGEWINTVITVKEFDEKGFLFFTTKSGQSKRVSLPHFKNIRRGGLIAINLRDEDELISVRLTDGTKDIGIATKQGYIIRFDENNVRSMGRVASGVRGIDLREDDEVVSMEIIEKESYILHVTNKGIGKRTIENQYRKTNRGGKGYYVCRLTEETGHVVAVKVVNGDEDLMLITIHGVLIRIPVQGIPITGRSTQGVRLIRLQGEEEVATVAKIVDEEIDEEVEENEEDIEEEKSEKEEEETKKSENESRSE